MENDTLKKVAKMLGAIKESDQMSKAQIEKERRDLVITVGKQISDSLTPVISELVYQTKVNKADIEEIISKLNINVTTPDVVVPEFPKITVPEPRVTVNVPPIKMPDIKIPDVVMPDTMKAILQNVDKANPLPVIMMGMDGKPMTFSFPVMGGGGGSTGGKSDFYTIKGFSASAFSDLQNSDGRLKVSVESGSSGLTDTELRASSVPVAQASGAIWSTEVTSIFGSTVTSDVINADNRLRVSVETGATGLTDTELRASSVPVEQVSGSSWTTEAHLHALDSSGAWEQVRTDSGVAVGALRVVHATDVGVSISATDLDIRDLVNATDSVSAYQVSGAIWSTEVTNTVTVTGSLTSSVVVGDIPSDTADDGSAPVKVGGIARTTNPSAVADGDRVSATFDKLGRQVMKPLQVRGLIATAYATLTTGTETTLLSGSAGVYHDLIYVMGANNSDVAVSVDIRAVTAGNKVISLEIPANATSGVALPVPFPQDATGNNWTADMGDITGTTVSLSALFSKEI